MCVLLVSRLWSHHHHQHRDMIARRAEALCFMLCTENTPSVHNNRLNDLRTSQRVLSDSVFLCVSIMCICICFMMRCVEDMCVSVCVQCLVNSTNSALVVHKSPCASGTWMMSMLYTVLLSVIHMTLYGQRYISCSVAARRWRWRLRHDLTHTRTPLT